MEYMLLIKLLVTMTLVVGLSLVVEHVSPRVAGLLAGYPLGGATVLFFIGLEISPQFAADSAVHTLVGLVGTQAFVYFYFKASLHFKRFEAAASSLAALVGYLIVAWLLHFVQPSKPVAAAIPIASIFLFVYLFRAIQNTRVKRAIRFSLRVLVGRALLAGLTVLAITGAARFVGTTWAGLFAAFPVTLFPLVLIVHLTYGTAHVHTIIKNFPIGIGSLIAYVLTVSLVYPRLGVYFGTLVSLAAATAYLLVYGLVRARK